LFSVVIPLYNKDSYIVKAVDSVLKQSYPEFELIIVDDGSTDNSLNKVTIIKDGRIKIISQKNKGVSTARNTGVDSSKFDFVAFLDADDWWEPGFLQQMKELIEAYPDGGLYGCNYYYVKNGKSIIEDKGLDADFRRGYIEYFKIYGKSLCVPFNCSFVVVPKTIFTESGGFNENLKFGEDFDLWIRIALKYKVCYLNIPLAYSNQDVDAKNRALGYLKHVPKEHHFIFNIPQQAKEQESINHHLKYLLDSLRLRSLLKYRLNNLYKEEIKSILSNVDLQSQPFGLQLYYYFPSYIGRSYLSFRNKLSLLKTRLLNP
jgi:glycosyltransferase involved in cell wall biosynthesis